MTRKATEDQYLLQQQLATDYGMKLNLGGINFLASPPPSAFSTSSFDCSPSSLSFSRSSSFSYGSVDSLQDYQPYITSSPYHSSNASLFSPSFYSSTTPWHDALPSPPPSSFSTFDYSYEAYEPTRPFTNLTDNKVIRPFAPPTAKLDEMLDRFVQQEVPWAGVVTTRDNWYPINDITNMAQGERHLLEMFDNSQDARNGGKIKSEKYKTEMCRSWEEQGSCRYDSKCQYAHGQEELRSVERHPRYKTELCRSYYQTGSCRYAKRCVFLHSPPSEGKPDNGEVATQVSVPLLSRVRRSVTQNNTTNNPKSPLDFWSSIRKDQCPVPE